MSVLFDEHMEYAIDCLQSHFTAEVTVRFRKPPFLDIGPEDIEVITINGFDNPWKYHEKVALDCEYLYYNFIELLNSLEKKRIAGLFDQVYSYFPPSPSSFSYRPFPVKGGKPSAFNSRFMFEEIGWHEEKQVENDAKDATEIDEQETDDMEFDDDDDDPGLKLPYAVEDKLFAAIWPYAQVVINNLAILQRNLRLIAMATYQGHPQVIPINNDIIAGLKWPTLTDLTEGPAAAKSHVIGIPCSSAS